MPLILAIDQSTSGTKALLCRTDGTVLDKESRDHRQIYPEPGWVEHDAEEIWQNLLAVVRTLLARHADADVAFCSITNQRETFVVFDRATGWPLGNAIVWQCRRGEPVCRELAEAGHESSIARATGLKLDTYFSGSKLAWLIRNQPDLAAKLRSGAALFGTIDTYLIHRLTGGAVFAADHTNASRTLLYDIHQRAFTPELCRLFDVPIAALPEVRDCNAQFGSTNFAGVLARPIPICGVMGDSQAALFAHHCFTPGEAKVTFGTGSSVLLTVGPQPRESTSGAVSAVAWVNSAKPTYCYEGIINYSAATIAWLKDQLGLIQSADESEALANGVPDTGGVYLVPAFAGLSAPWWEPNARAAIVGMSAGTNRCHIARAALESIAYQVRDVLEMMSTAAGVSIAAIHADGGATANRFLMQFVADMTGAEIHVSDMADCSALGAAMAGALGMGLYPNAGALPAQPFTTYRPAMPRAHADALYAGWKNAVRQVITGAHT